MAKINVPSWDYTGLCAFADKYLARMHPTGLVPIPIEDIIELQEMIEVIPVEDLMVDGHEAYTIPSAKTIYIDKQIYCRNDPNRRRFTLAHELAHILLHEGVLKSATYTDIAGWKEFQSTLSNADILEMEKQANNLAGLILVPKAQLLTAYLAVGESTKARGLDIATLKGGSLKLVAKKIAETFEVSHGVVEIRGMFDNLWTRAALNAP